MRSRILIIVCGALLLAGAVGMVAWVSLNSTAQRVWQPLAQRLPMEIDGWIGEDMPIEPVKTEDVANRLLNYSDYVYRVYRKDGVAICIYGMFWRQGRISVREIAGHTPDGCWIANGASFVANPVTKSFMVRGRMTAPGELRTFSFGTDKSVNVVWWHIWGQNIVDAPYARKTPLTLVKELWEWLAVRRGSRQDQMLIRIHSASPMDEVMQSAPVAAFLATFPEIFMSDKM